MRGTDLSCTRLLGFLFLKSDCRLQLKTAATTNTHGQTDKTPRCPSCSEGPAPPAAGPGSLTPACPSACPPTKPSRKQTDGKEAVGCESESWLIGITTWDRRRGPSPFTRLATSFMPARGPGRGMTPLAREAGVRVPAPVRTPVGSRVGLCPVDVHGSVKDSGDHSVWQWQGPPKPRRYSGGRPPPITHCPAQGHMHPQGVRPTQERMYFEVWQVWGPQGGSEAFVTPVLGFSGRKTEGCVTTAHRRWRAAQGHLQKQGSRKLAGVTWPLGSLQVLWA